MDQAEEDKKILNQQIDNLAQNHKETNDKALDLEATIFQLQSNLKQSDSQIQSLCQLAEEVEDNENSIYVPQKVGRWNFKRLFNRMILLILLLQIL